jgi:hypothetical protein
VDVYLCRDLLAPVGVSAAACGLALAGLFLALARTSRRRPGRTRGFAPASAVALVAVAVAGGAFSLDRALLAWAPAAEATAGPPVPPSPVAPGGDADFEPWTGRRMPVGSAAPDLALPDVRTGEPTRLLGGGAGGPVVLVFGSWT